MDDTVRELGELLSAQAGDVISGFEIQFGALVLHTDVHGIEALVRLIKTDKRFAFTSLIDVCGVDYPGRGQRFDVVYHFLSPTLNQRVRIKLVTDDKTPVPSITGLFPGADWFEREAYDMYGILFSDHPELRRILTDYGFDGYPLRKDFPLTGFVEVRYDDEKKRVVYDKVKLTQEFRNFDYLSPWEGTDYVLPGDEKAKDQEDAS